MSGQKSTAANDKNPLEQTIELLLDRAVAAGASTVHIEPRSNLTVVRFRTDNHLTDAAKLPKEHHQRIVSHIKAQLGEDDQLLHRNTAIRVTSLPLVEGEKIVLHFIPQKRQILDLPALGFWGSGLAAIEHALHEPHGVLLGASLEHNVASQTNTAMAQLAQAAQRSIVTIDSSTPPLDGINQMPAERREMSTQRLRQALQLDADVIVVGNVVDKNLAELAFEASLGHHLLLGHMHAPSAAHVFRRALDMGVPPYEVAAALQIATGQRKVRRLCADCREVYKPTAGRVNKLVARSGHSVAQLHKLEQQAARSYSPAQELSSDETSVHRLWKASQIGCNNCNFSGYNGWLALTEVMATGHELQQAVVANKSSQELEAVAVGAGMVTLITDGIVKALRGLTTLEEIGLAR